MAQRVRRENDPWMPRRELLALGGSSMVAASIGGMPVMANLAVCQVECFGRRLFLFFFGCFPDKFG